MEKPPVKPDHLQLQAYLQGEASAEVAKIVEQYAAYDGEFRQMLDEKRASAEVLAILGKMAPPTSSKSKLFQRLEIQDDPVGRDFPPYLNANSKLADFEPWLGDALEKLALSTEDFDCVTIGSSEDTFTFLAKMCSSIPEEVHVGELERVMVIEGVCDFVVGQEVFHFGPGDRCQIPLYTPHRAYVTTAQPCIFLVQRTVL